MCKGGNSGFRLEHCSVNIYIFGLTKYCCVRHLFAKKLRKEKKYCLFSSFIPQHGEEFKVLPNLFSLMILLILSLSIVTPPTCLIMNTSFDPSMVMMEEGQFGYPVSHQDVVPLNATQSPMSVPSSNSLIQNQTPYVRMSTQFSGLMAESGTDFLNEFEAYLVLVNIEQSSPKSSAAFQLQLKGPALTWYMTLPKGCKSNYDTLKPLFLQEYNDNNSLALVAEEAMFSALRLNPNQQIEELHATILHKGA